MPNPDDSTQIPIEPYPNPDQDVTLPGSQILIGIPEEKRGPGLGQTLLFAVCPIRKVPGRTFFSKCLFRRALPATAVWALRAHRPPVCGTMRRPVQPRARGTARHASVDPSRQLQTSL